MIKLHWDPHPATTKKKPSPSASASALSSSSTTSAVAQLLLRWRGRSSAAKDESIEFFSALRNNQPDRGASDHAGRGGTPDERGVAKRAAVFGGSGDGGGEQLLTTGTGKHDYDWLLTPPESPLRSPATNATTGHRVSTPAPRRLERASSASYAKGNSRLPLTRRENGTPASRLARSSSATSQPSSAVQAPGAMFSGRPSYGRTLSSASVSSVNTVSNASVSSTPRGSSSATSPRTPVTAKSAPAVAAAARSRHRDRTQALRVFGSVAAGQPNASAAASRSRPSPTAVTTSGTRLRATAGATGTSSPRSTTATSQQPVATRRGANTVARSGPVRQTAAGSTAKAASPTPPPRDVNLAAGAFRVAPTSFSSKSRQVPASGKQRNGNALAAASTTAQRWLPAPPTAATAVAGRNARREEPFAHGSSRNSDSRRKIDVANTSTAARRTVELSSSRGMNGGSPTSTGGRNKPTDTDVKRLWQGAAARHLISAVHRDATPTPRSSRSSVASRSRLGIMSVPSSGSESTTGRRSTPAKGRPAAAAAASPGVAVPDAFASTRYDAMLLREDPRNLTWLHGCDEDDDGIGGGGQVEASLESFDVPAGSSSTGLHGCAALNFGAYLEGRHVI
ncbi:hypothetical protein E2562_038064 [Oryza meyeriana var. granulata]|uniref:Uncharacterized protein n=1 Tax=Oryza meyeriana var. granulata TaxID=110450 RepID=A0A6G1EU58_9ORYZ|nr:hypothetical protein E2562_038064 [Oryza meyeriana var. granulata]